MVIYCFTFPNGKRYIGKTEKDFEIRMRSHRYGAKYLKRSVYNAVRKYGWDSINIDILCECDTIEELNEREKELILFYNTMDPKSGYNLREGGEGGSHSQITKDKISSKNTGKGNGMFKKEPWNKGKKLSKEHIENLRKSHLGQVPWNKGKKLPPKGPRSKETKRKISEANSGENNGQAKLTCEIVKKIREDYATGDYKQKELMKKYSLTSERVSKIVNNKVWRKCD
jgi:group I intron endonuclease